MINYVNYDNYGNYDNFQMVLSRKTLQSTLGPPQCPLANRYEKLFVRVPVVFRKA